MKKYMILIATLALSLAVSAQRPERRSTEQSTADRKKSEATTQRTRTDVSRTSKTETRTRTERTTTPQQNKTAQRSTSTQRTNSDQNRQANRSAETRTVQRETPVQNRTVTRTTTTRTNTNQNNRSTVTRSQNNTGNQDSRGSDSNVRTRTNTEVSRNNNTATRTANRTSEGRTYEAERRVYHTPNRSRVTHSNHVHATRPRPVEYRRIYYVYREPVHVHVIWTHNMYRNYVRWYPEYMYWDYPMGYRIRTLSAYDAAYHIGEVRNIYGIVNQTWYSRETDEYYLYFGVGYPYQDFTVIIPGRKARRFSHRPEQFFQGRHIWVTGLISMYEGKPEMLIKRTSQVNLY